MWFPDTQEGVRKMSAEAQLKERLAPFVVVDTADLPRDDWLNYRRRGIGGSDVAAILGVSPFRTARDIFYGATRSQLKRLGTKNQKDS